MSPEAIKATIYILVFLAIVAAVLARFAAAIAFLMTHDAGRFMVTAGLFLVDLADYLYHYDSTFGPGPGQFRSLRQLVRHCWQINQDNEWM